MSSIPVEMLAAKWLVPPYMITDPGWWDATPKRNGVSMITLMGAGVRYVTAGHAKKWGMGRKGGGAIIPYRRYDNRAPLVVDQVLPWKTTKLEIARLRRNKDVENDGQGKYDQAPKTGTQIYVPPQFPVGEVEVDTEVLVEGEFKALSLMEMGYASIGLSGITGWSMRTEDGIRRILPALLEIIRKTKPKKIFYLGDNDVALNGDFYREVALFVEQLTVSEGIQIPVFMPRWSLTMPKGVDDVRGGMTADEFVSWWEEVSRNAIPVPAGTTAAQIGKILLESCKDYVAACNEKVAREDIWKRLVKVYSYHRKNLGFQSWLKSYTRDCGFSPAALDGAAAALRENQAEDIRAKQAARNGTSKSNSTGSTGNNSSGATKPTGSAADPIKGTPASTGFPEIENSMVLVQDSSLQLPPELVKGLIHLGTKTIIGGGSKIGKTWLLLDLALSVATGLPFWGLETQKGKVLYINMEIHRAFTKRRIEFVTSARGITEHSNLDIWNLRGHATALGKLLDVILPKITDGGYVMVIVDPIYKVFGRRDENNASEMAELCNEFEIIAVETGAAVAYAHHFSKGPQHAKTPMDRMSGSGVWGRDPDSIVTLLPHATDDSYIVESSLRNLPALRPFVVKWKFPLMIPVDLNPGDYRVLGGRKPKHKPSDIFLLIEETALKTTAWQKAAQKEMGIPKTSFMRLFKKALKDGLITQDEHDCWKPAEITETEEVPEVPE